MLLVKNEFQIKINFDSCFFFFPQPINDEQSKVELF